MLNRPSTYITVAALSLALVSTSVAIKAKLNYRDLLDTVRHQEAAPAMGGAESPVEETLPITDGYLFPIHQKDYLVLTSAFGERVSPILHVNKVHDGVDIATIVNAQIVSVSDGIVLHHYHPPGTKIGDTVYKGHSKYGGFIVIQHDDGVICRYGHLSWTNRAKVHENHRVRKGDVIGRQGMTGLATGHHLHFEVEVSGELQNPLHYIPMPEGMIW